MSHYKLNNEIYWFDTSEEASQYQPDAIQITDIESDAIRISKIVPPTIEQVRVQRDQLLTQSDWAILPDSPFTTAQKTLWKSYRQALRDITSDPLFPNVTFPVKPF